MILLDFFVEYVKVVNGITCTIQTENGAFDMNPARFVFPGFTLIKPADTKTHEIEIGRIKQGDAVFIVHMIRKANLDFEGNFLVAKILDTSGKNCLWEFQKQGFSGLGLLAQAGDQLVVALVGKGREGKVEGVVPFSSLVGHQPLNLLRKVALKRLAAQYLGRDCNLTDVERKVAKRDSERRLAEEEAARERKIEERRLAREEATMLIMKRGKVEAFTADGSRRFGLPVTDDEWPKLSNNTYVVLVDGIDDNTGQIGAPIEAFQIVKEKGRNPQKGRPSPVTWERPVMVGKTTTANMPKPVQTIAIEIDGDAFEVAVYPTMDDVRQARKLGLNGGSYVTAEDKGEDGRFEVYSVHSDRIDTLGLFESIA